MPIKDPEKRKAQHAALEKRRRVERKEAAARDSRPEKKKKAAIPPPPVRKALNYPPAPVIPQAAEPLSLPQDTKNELSGFSEKEITDARALIDKTYEDIDRRGWTMWRCTKLNNDVIVIVKDSKVLTYPLGYPVYTISEIEQSAGMSPGTVKLIHAAKVAGVQDALPGLFPEIISAK